MDLFIVAVALAVLIPFLVFLSRRMETHSMSAQKTRQDSRRERHLLGRADGSIRRRPRAARTQKHA